MSNRYSLGLISLKFLICNNKDKRHPVNPHNLSKIGESANNLNQSFKEMYNLVSWGFNPSNLKHWSPLAFLLSCVTYIIQKTLTSPPSLKGTYQSTSTRENTDCGFIRCLSQKMLYRGWTKYPIKFNSMCNCFGFKPKFDAKVWFIYLKSWVRKMQ